ncbi:MULTISPECIES: DNA polymerase III subunit delta [unclassified Lactobacillus]|uniref:DNA polymerase III subunit delta n=1 Tax=unclassified Lactobacillus TaxID=2620435 RepID=UPI000EFCF257|nr:MULTISPECIES: DNA polymerase III subunit delta [unclassified Lactobacillus]RMC25138.1 DNA polymerase III subunit delta [Lactobacillus sp. ESL0247]RMC29292.1 DNA polymerase III subunit delta [Lactobacillus sp. ESL0246]RMC32313.1 DNA polymerase III subunit delta [Lactobacillus sp. ESL0245]RMC48729.1 DNA polymerase III subunit delta [Lactobacillus sp. ESL0228]
MSLLSIFKNSNKNKQQTLITGDDNFLNDYLARFFTHEEIFSSFDKLTIDCEIDSLDELIAELTESSLFSQKKIITVKNPFFLTAKVPQKFKRQLEQLQQIFANIDQLDDIVVLVASYDKLDRRKKLTKTILNNFNVVDTKIKNYEVSKTIQAMIKSEGYQISTSALHLLLERSDQVLDTTLSNFNKLKALANDGKITIEEIEKNIDLSLAQNVFSIMETALNHDYREAIERLENQLREGSNPIQLLAVFENQLELILVVKILKKRGRSESEIAKLLGIHPYRVKVALRNQLTISKLEILLKRAIELDFNYKNGRYRESDFLKLFILSV